MRVIHVARKPLSEGNVASNILKHGCGAINVDASRISGALHSSERRVSQPGGGSVDGIYGDMQGYVQDGERHNSKGRWPANLILQHLPGCECVGTKKIPGRTGRDSRGRAHSKYRFQGHGQSWQDDHPGLADLDGKETVAAWKCEPDCPVAALDRQSGSHCGAQRPVKGTEESVPGTNTYSTWKRTPFQTYDDSGGAARFFKQVQE